MKNLWKVGQIQSCKNGAYTSRAVSKKNTIFSKLVMLVQQECQTHITGHIYGLPRKAFMNFGKPYV